MSARQPRSPRLPALAGPGLGREAGRTFGVFGLLLLEARLQLSRVVVETFEGLMEDPVLGLHSRVDAQHGSVQLVIRDASFHVPEDSNGTNISKLSRTCGTQAGAQHEITWPLCKCRPALRVSKHAQSHTTVSLSRTNALRS